MNADRIDETAPVVVIGAGQAGFSASAKLRDLGHTGPITLVGNEAQPPYQRPPLSKAYLLGEMTEERLYFRPRAFYEQKAIDLRLSASATRIDRSARQVELSDGTTLSYGRLILATGARPRTLPAAFGGHLTGIHYVRTLADINALAAEFRQGRHVLIIGGGYIGLEAAAVSAKLGLRVTLVETAPRILQRVAAAETSDYFRRLHLANGVDLREGTGLEALLGNNGRVCLAKLSDGTSLPVDFVIAGIGVHPNAELAEAAGLETDNGISVDVHCRTTDPMILAAGDCASFPSQGKLIRLESVGNAIDQGEAAARTIKGQSQGYEAKPWFWSDQFDIKLQIAGLSAGYDCVATRTGAGASVSFWYYRREQLLAVDAINDPRAYMVAKRLIEAGKSPAPVHATDPSIDLRSLLNCCCYSRRAGS
jgi:3-phenylpropionate/trans-cinnamate dioxygenase ferredoxin reductase component